MSNTDNSTFVIVPVRIQISGGEICTVELPELSDVQASLKALGPIADKGKLLKLLGSYGGMLKGLLK